MRRGLGPGLHMYNGQGDLKGHRFHLRVDAQDRGVLIIDASKLIFLTGTALDYLKCILEGRGEAGTVKYMRKMYRKLDKKTAKAHYSNVLEQLREILEGNLYVVENIGVDSPTIGADSLPAPYRVDLALVFLVVFPATCCVVLLPEARRRLATLRKTREER